MDFQKHQKHQKHQHTQQSQQKVGKRESEHVVELDDTWDIPSHAAHSPTSLIRYLDVSPERSPKQHQFRAITRMLGSPRDHGWLLADEPGLGKTITLLLMARLAWKLDTEDPAHLCRPALAVVPKGTIAHWKHEAKYVYRDPRASVFVYTGNSPSARKKRLQAWVRAHPGARIALYITTHGTLRSETDSFLRGVTFDALILDEAHILRHAPILGSPTSSTGKEHKTAKALLTLIPRSRVRYVATGTPIMNVERDVLPLAYFVHHGEAADPKWFFKHDTTSHIASPDPNESPVSRKLRTWVAGYCIRRRRQDVIDADPEMVMPEKRIHMHYLAFGDTELETVRTFTQRIADFYTVWLANEDHTRGELTSQLLNMWLQLRQVCVSRALIKGETVGYNVGVIDHEKAAKQGTLWDGPSFIAYAYDAMQALDRDQEIPTHISATLLNIASESTKLRYALRHIFNLVNNDSRVPAPNGRIDYAAERPQAYRTIVVTSQFVTALKLMACLLRCPSIRTLYAPRRYRMPQVALYHGGLSNKNRERILQEARSTRGPMVVLTSLRAGNLGIDMTFGNDMIFLDQWWNDATKRQMEDRMHRPSSIIARTDHVREANIHHLIVVGSAEDYQLNITTGKYETAMSLFGTRGERRFAHTRHAEFKERAAGFNVKGAVEHMLQARDQWAVDPTLRSGCCLRVDVSTPNASIKEHELQQNPAAKQVVRPRVPTVSVPSSASTSSVLPTADQYPGMASFAGYKGGEAAEKTIPPVIKRKRKTKSKKTRVLQTPEKKRARTQCETPPAVTEDSVLHEAIECISKKNADFSQMSSNVKRRLVWDSKVRLQTHNLEPNSSNIAALGLKILERANVGVKREAE